MPSPKQTNFGKALSQTSDLFTRVLDWVKIQIGWGLSQGPTSLSLFLFSRVEGLLWLNQLT